MPDDNKEGQTKTKTNPDISRPPEAAEEKAQSENSERAQEINMKIQVGNEISHAKRMDTLAELSVTNAIVFAQKANDAYLERMKQMADAYMEQSKGQALAAAEMSKKQGEETLNFATQWHHHAIENNRFTLDRLYGVFPEEAAGIAAMYVGLAEVLIANGWMPPAAAK